MTLLKGHIPWNKGLKGLKPWMNISGFGKNIDFKKRGQSISKSMLGLKRSDEYKKKRSELMKKKWSDSEYRKNQIKSQTGKKLSIEHRKKLSKIFMGEKSSNWKGGITSINQKIRGSIEYKLWRTAVFERDHYACVWCGDNKGGNLEADHIKPFCDYPELRFAIDNGRTLCKDCHRKTDTYGYKYYKTKEKI